MWSRITVTSAPACHPSDPPVREDWDKDASADRTYRKHSTPPETAGGDQRSGGWNGPDVLGVY